MSSAKDGILQRIANAARPGLRISETPATAWSLRPQSEIVEQFAEFAAEYKAEVHLTSRAEAAQKIASLLGSGRTVIAADFPRELIAPGIETVVDEQLSARDLDGIEASATLCAAAIAETGTVVLDGGPGQGRRAITLIPDHHVCVVYADQVVDSVPEAVEKLYASVAAGRPLTWISGPSATSDIELTRVEGVHGARRLDIVLVQG